MRYCTVFIFILCSYQYAISQWRNIYPLTDTPIDVSVVTPGYVFLITSDNGRSHVLKSIDEARTWKSFEVTDEDLTSIFFIDSLRGFVTSYKGVYRTTDGARTWHLVTIANGFPAASEIVFTSSTIGYLRSGNNRMAKTTNGGDSWGVLNNAPQATVDYGNAFAFANNSIGYAISDNKLYKTLDGATTWAPISSNYPAASIFPLDENVAYISAGYNLYKTIDGGQTWEPANYINARFMHFKDETEGLLFSDYSEIYQTTNGGQNTNYVYHSNFPFSWRQVSFSENFGCALGSDNAILTTTDGGNSWKLNQVRPQHGEFRDVHFTSQNDGFIIGEDRGVIRTDDNATSWYYNEHHFERDDLYQMAFSHADTGIFVVTNNYAYTTYDGGKTMFLNGWSPPIIGHLASRDYEMINSKVIYTVGENAKVAKSVDGGKSWTSFSFNFSNGLSAIECLDANTCHAAGSSGIVISTWDGGAHWKMHDLPLNNDLKEVFLLDEKIGFIGGGQGVILRTINGGQDWNLQSTEAQLAVLGFHFITSEKGYAVTEGGEVLRTNNAGMDWTLVQGTGEVGSAYYTLRKTFMRDTAHIYGFTQENIFRWSSSFAPDVITSIESISQSIAIFPNPTTDWLYVTLPEQVESIKVMNMNGMVLQKYEGKTTAMNVHDLAPGIYIAQIISSDHIQVIKFIKQ